jgi:uncharacterized membrane protein
MCRFGLSAGANLGAAANQFIKNVKCKCKNAKNNQQR